MEINRSEIVKICEENKINTVKQLIEYLDFKEFQNLVSAKSKELSEGIFMFRYRDKEESLDYFKANLYKNMILEGRFLNKKQCMNYYHNTCIEYERSELWNKK